MNRRFWGLILLGFALSGVCGGGAWFFCKLRGTVDRMVEAEQRLHAGLFAAEAVHQYLESHDYEQWPSCWEDLEPYAHGSVAWLEWPADADQFPQYVTIDFQVSIEAALAVDPGSFDGIRPTPGPIYTPGHVQGAVEHVLDELRKHHVGESGRQLGPSEPDASLSARETSISGGS